MARAAKANKESVAVDGSGIVSVPDNTRAPCSVTEYEALLTLTVPPIEGITTASAVMEKSVLLSSFSKSTSPLTPLLMSVSENTYSMRLSLSGFANDASKTVSPPKTMETHASSAIVTTPSSVCIMIFA